MKQTSTDRSFARRIDLASLQLFVAVCELGSIGRAAEQACLAASAASKRLSDLEAAAGTALLTRHSRGAVPTPAGESLLHHARTVLFGLERMQSELGEYAGGVRGHVRMHANISAIVQFLPEDLGAFARAQPEVKIDLEEHLSHQVMHAIREGAADIGICHAPAEGHGDDALPSRPYRQDHLVLVVPQAHVIRSDDAIDFEAALDYDIIGLHHHSSIGMAMQRAAALQGKTLKLRMQVTGLDAMCRMIDNGLGIGVLPDKAFALMQGVGHLRAIALRDDWAHRELRIVARDFDSLPVTTRLLVEHLAPPAPAASTPAAT